MIIVLLFVVLRSRVGNSMGVKVEDVELFEATDFVGLSTMQKFKNTRWFTHDGLRSRSTKFRIKIYVSHKTFSTRDNVKARSDVDHIGNLHLFDRHFNLQVVVKTNCALMELARRVTIKTIT
jgi:hypothetical protein